MLARPSGRLLLLALFLAGAARSQAGSAETEMLVEAGHTPWSIAHKHQARVRDLLLANDLDDDTAGSRAGQLIHLPPPDPAPVPPTAPETPAEATPPPTVPIPDNVVPEATLAWPLRGHLTSRYGWRKRSFHTGVDIAAPPGTIITAAAAGRVERAGDSWGRYGRVLILDHGQGRRTLYAHTARVFVRLGDTVQMGQAIAAVGRTGNATGPHLHFEVWLGDKTQDPLALLGFLDRAPSLASRVRSSFDAH